MDNFLIIKPIITEKATDLSGLGKYVFRVKDSATKNEVKKAVKGIYHVDAVAVNIVNLPAKPRSYRGKKHAKPGYKKAVVTLKKDQKIDLAA